MALPQQLPGISVVPQAPQVDPRLFALDVQGALASAQLGMKLGQEMAGLQNLKGKLELEKAEIAAKKAANTYEERKALQAMEQLPLLVQAQQAELEAKKAQSMALLSVLPSKTESEIATTRLAGVTAGTNLEGALRFQERGGGSLLGDTALSTAKTAFKQAGKTQAELAGETARESAKGKALGDIEGLQAAANPGAEAPAPTPAPFYLQKVLEVDAKRTGKPRVDVYGTSNLPPWAIEHRTTEVSRPDGTRVSVSQGFNKFSGKPIPGEREEIAVVGVKDEPDRAKIIGLLQAVKMAERLDATLKDYDEKGQGGLFQAGAAKLANRQIADENLLLLPFSVGMKAAGMAYQSEATAAAASQLAELNSTILRNVSGSTVTSSEKGSTSPLLPDVGDLVKPSAARAKVKKTLDYLKTQLEPYEKSGAIQRSRLDATEPGTTTQAAQPSTDKSAHPLYGVPGQPGEVRTTPQGTYKLITNQAGKLVWKKQ